MIKSLEKYQIRTTPFVSTKTWLLSNQLNNDLILCENGDTLALEFVDYDISVNPVINYSCSIALEQQDEDLLTYREGEKRTGIVYDNTEPKNLDETYKRSVYSQIFTTFYNKYKDPNKIWGLENIDFELSKTKRFLSDKIRVFYVPTEIFGDKIRENTIHITDNSLDNPYVITDDGYCNLNAGLNLFSKEQEVGFFDNQFITGSNDDCLSYFNFDPPQAPLNLTVSQTASVLLNWIDPNPVEIESGIVVEKKIETGPFLPIQYLSPGTSSTVDSDTTFEVSYSYRVYSYNSYGNSSYSNVASIIMHMLPYQLSSSNFNFWLTPNVLEGTSSGTPIGVWNSISTSVSTSVIQPSATNQAIYITSSFGDWGGVVFDGIDDFYSPVNFDPKSIAPVGVLDNVKCTIAAVIRPASGSLIRIFGDSDNSCDIAYVGNSTGMRSYSKGGGAIPIYSDYFSSSLSQSVVLWYVCDGTNTLFYENKWYRNGYAAASLAFHTSLLDYFGYTSLSKFMSASVAEVCVWSASFLGPNEITNLYDNYFEPKYRNTPGGLYNP